MDRRGLRSDTNFSKGYGQARKREPFRQKLRIAITIDSSRSPSRWSTGTASRRRRESRSPGDHLTEGCTVVHDKERAHNGVIADRKCTS